MRWPGILGVAGLSSPAWALRGALTAAALVGLFPTIAAAQAPRVLTALDTTLVSVGDRLQLTVTVEHAPGETVVWPDSLDLDPFEILGAELLAPTQIEGRVVSGVRMVLTVFELGDLAVPAFDLSVEASDGTSTAVSTDAFGVTVQSVGLDEGGDIRAIRGPLGIPIGLIYVLPWLLLLIAVGAAAFWLWRRSRKGGSPDRRSVIIPRLPHEEAHEALDRLEASSLLEQGEIKQYHIDVSEIIRTYIEGRFDVYALEMTTGEVMAGLREANVEHGALVALEAFLNRCDMVKFAKFRPTSDACRQTLAAAREWVDSTRPRAMESTAGPAEGPTEGSTEAPAPTAPVEGPIADGETDPVLETTGAEGA